MKQNRKTLLITSVLFMLAIWGFIAVERGTSLFQGLDLLIFALIVILGIVALVNAIKKDREEKEGFPADDERSTQIKYKAGYYAYLLSMYMWLFIFLLKDKFPDTESMLGGGILLSAALAVITKFVIKYNFSE